MLNNSWIELTKDNHPISGELVLIFGFNEHGKRRTLRAFYAPKFSIKDSTEFEAAEYNKLDDEFYLKQGWYESNEFEYVHWMVDFKITHYMPMPEPPIQNKL